MYSKRNRSRGFTLVELLVVITIIGMLMALILPAVNMARNTARGVQCKNNLKNLAIAINTFENTKKRFPGYLNPLGDRPVSWIPTLFPYLERNDLYQAWKDPASLNPRPSWEITICPSDPPEISGKPANSYVINGGRATLSVSEEKQADGIAFAEIRNTSGYLTAGDGATTTLLLTENVQATTWDGSPFFPAKSDWDGFPLKETTTFLWHPTNNPSPLQKINGTLPGSTLSDIPPSVDTARPSSFHSGGVFVAFCDYHVTFLREDIDYKVYIQLMTSNHRESSIQATAFNDYKLYTLNGADYE